MASGDDDPAYYVSDEQLDVFLAQPVERRLRWLDETRAFILQTASEETRARWVAERQREPTR